VYVLSICFLCVLGDELFYKTDVASWDYLVNQIKRVHLKWSITPKWCSQFNDVILSLTVVVKNCPFMLEDAIYKLTVEEVSSQVLILVGVPGAGKTTMVRQLLHNWARSASSSHYALIMYANVSIDGSKITGLQSLIALQLERSPDSEMVNKMNEILIKQQGEGVLIILDDYDKTISDSTQNSFINSLLSRELLPKCSLLLVCHPDCVPNEHCKTLIEIPALNNDQVSNYLQQTVGPVCTAAVNTSQVWSLIYNPLLLNIICYLIKSGIDVTGISTLTKLYQIFILKALSDCVKRDDNHSATVRSLLKVLATASYDGLSCKKQTLDSLSDLDTFVESGIVERHSTVATHNFVHLTIQEYLVAYHIVHSQCDRESLLANVKCDFFLSAFLSGLTGKLFSTSVQNSLAVVSICYAEARWAWKTASEGPPPFTEVLILDILTLTPYHLNCIKVFLKEAHIREVDISGYDYKRAELLNFVQLHDINKQVTLLPKCAECIYDIMSCRYLTNLNAEYVNLSLTMWRGFANMLKSNTSLLQLNVSHSNTIDYEVVNIIAESLTVNKCLQTLQMKFCNLDNSHADCIIMALLSNKTLHHLDLSNNLIKELNINVVKKIVELGVIQVIR